MGLLRRILDRSSGYLALEKPLRALLTTSVVTSLGGSLYGSLLGLHITNNLGASILVFGLMNTVQSLVSSLTIFPSGFLSDNFGRKNIMILAIVFSLSALIVLLLAEDLHGFSLS